MASLIDDLRYGFLQRHGAVAQLIVINVSIYLAIAILSVLTWLGGLGSLDDLAYEWLGMPPQLERLATRPWTLGTYMFLHSFSGILHILFNMLWLYWIGRILREYQGDRRIWVTFVGGGLVGGIMYILFYNLIPAFNAASGPPLVGASGGVLAIVVATATLLPDYPLPLLFFGMIRLKWLAAIMVVLDLIMMPRGNPGGMIAHLGGALFGFLYIRTLQSGTDWNPMARMFDPSRRAVRVVRTAGERPARGSARPARAAKPGSPSEDEINRILDKIKAVGYDRLTKEEKQTLFNASQEK